MAKKIKDIDEEPVEEEVVGPPSPLVYVKAVFLLLIIVGGLLGIEQAAKRNSRYTQKEVPKIELNLQDNAAVEDTVEQGRDLLDDTMDLAEEQKEMVLGEATEVAASATASVKESMMDYVYENTVEVVIQKMIEQLPEKQREEFIEEVSAK
ncbi:MAG: hypothetical protein ACEQSA_04545 [Weeksellaceae bacterium]